MTYNPLRDKSPGTSSSYFVYFCFARGCILYDLDFSYNVHKLSGLKLIDKLQVGSSHSREQVSSRFLDTNDLFFICCNLLAVVVVYLFAVVVFGDNEIFKTILNSSGKFDFRMLISKNSLSLMKFKYYHFQTQETKIVIWVIKITFEMKCWATNLSQIQCSVKS